MIRITWTLIYLSTLLLSCKGPSLSPTDRYPSQSTTISEYDLDCEVLKKGCLLKRESDTVILFFRGWVEPEHMKKYTGLRKRVDEKFWIQSARDLIYNGMMPLSRAEMASSLFVTGSAHLPLTQEEMEQILNAANAKFLILASHSGGYVGMRASILPISKDYWEKVSAIWMLDNYYGAEGFAQDLKRNFGAEFLRDHCYGFVTDHNMKRYQASYKSLCPQTRTSGVTHTGGVLTCMPKFDQDKTCQ